MRDRSCSAGPFEWTRDTPSSRLAPGVRGYRGYRIPLHRPYERLHVPGGTVTLTVLFGGGMRVSSRPGAGDGCTGVASASLAGLHTRARTSEYSGPVHGLEVAFAPWAAFRVFGVPMHGLTDTVVHPRELLGARFDGLAGELAAAGDWPACFRRLDGALARWAEAGPAYSPGVVWAWRELERTGGRIPIRRLVEGSEWGWRALENRFRDQVGVPPKTVARILRLRRTVHLLRAGRPPAEVAALCGYSDQAHLAREVKRMTGHTPALLRTGTPSA
ncbi:helix-turn-helix domain-containing protein (plasmid) [Streptomyces sp. BI20]|uniref:helix-turn-helix domain-containing protein n=1 Tax=Streptomyces sp. BI20 TaxID=3403460 RepID=UPI003C778E9B